MSVSKNQSTFETSDEISILELFQLLFRYIWLIIVLTLVGGVIAFSVSTFILEPTYVASSTVYIRPRVNDGQISTGELAANARLANTYAEIARSNAVLRNITVSGFNVTQLRNSISISAVRDTEIMRFSSTTTSPTSSATIVNQVVNAFISEVYEIIEIENLYVIDQAEPNYNKVGPNVLLNTLIGLVLGGMVSIGIIFLITMIDNTLSSREQVEALLEVPVLGEIRYVD
jgi:capsular polysaccharide biosynthesis protein